MKRPLRKTRKYVHWTEMVSFWSWLYGYWNFINSNFEREIGTRYFGIERVSYYEVPMGELRF